MQRIVTELAEIQPATGGSIRRAPSPDTLQPLWQLRWDRNFAAAHSNQHGLVAASIVNTSSASCHTSAATGGHGG